MLCSRLIAAGASLVIALSAARLEAAPAEAKAHYEEAARRYAEQDYEAAAREFAIAYALDPRVETMFAWAQAERLAERYDEAAKLYRRLLEDRLTTKQRDAVEGLLAEIEALRAEQPIDDAEPQPKQGHDEDPAVSADTGSSTTDADPRTRGPARALVGVGAGSLALGGGLLVAGLVLDARVRNATTYAQFDERYDPATGRGKRAVPLYVSGGLVLGVGLVALIVGAVRLAKHPRASAGAGAEQGPRLTVGQGVGVAW